MDHIVKDWFVSSHTAVANTCVQVRVRSGSIDVRNSVNPDAGTANFSKDKWASFVDGVKRGLV